LKTSIRASWATLALRAGLAACGAAFLLTACGGDDDDPLLRRIHLGDVRGAEDATAGTYAWKGIPFAKPPVGALRWQPPQ